MGDLIFFILSTGVALYAVYLFTFCLYKVDYDGKMTDRVVFPRIVYLIAVILASLPLLNLFCIVIFLVYLAIWSDDYRVKSWLFEKPKQKEKADDGACQHGR